VSNASKPISLYPLDLKEAVSSLLKVKPPAKKKKSPKPKKGVDKKGKS